MWFQYFLYNGGGGKVWKPVFVIVLKLPLAHWRPGCPILYYLLSHQHGFFLKFRV